MKKSVVSIITATFLLISIFAVPSFGAANYTPQTDNYVWTEWSTEVPPYGASYESKTQYSYRDKSFVTNGYYTYSGYTRSASNLVSTTNGNWSLKQPTTSDTESSTYRTIVSNETKSAYCSFGYVCNCKSWFWKNNKGSHKSGCKTKNLLKIYSAKSLSGAGFSYDSSDGSYKVPKKIGTSYPDKFGTVYLTTYNGNRTSYFSSAVSCTYLWKSSSNTATIYRPVTKKYQYTHWKWGNWSSYADSYVASSNNREVQTRTLYRYKSSGQHINGESTFNKVYGDGPFDLGANASTSLTYSSNNPNVASVSAEGTVTIKGAGTAMITIKAAATDLYNGTQKIVTVNVAKASPHLVYNGPENINKTYSGTSFSVKATSIVGVKYSSNKPDVLTVSSDGVVKMNGSGTAVITIQSITNNNYDIESTNVIVNVSKANQVIKVNAKSSVSKVVGSKTFNLGAKAKTKLTYSSSNKKVATVSSDGKVTVKKPGTAIITVKAAATSKYNSANKKITVKGSLKKPVFTVKTIKVKGKRKAKLSWKKVPGADGYQIHSPNSTYKNKRYLKVDSTILNVKQNIKKGKTYRYRVRAYSVVNGKIVYGPYSAYKKVVCK